MHFLSIKIFYLFYLFLKNSGDAYVDNTPVEVIREARMNGDLTPAFDNTIEENLRLFDEMRKGSEEGVKCILRARIIDSKWGPMKNPNKALRDPALYRTVTDCDHNRTGYVFSLSVVLYCSIFI